ncbi:MAG: hypothetical protein ACNS62_17180 [Candidatus Cyclobacteriaceae bacterium M3_2C_046]
MKTNIIYSFIALLLLNTAVLKADVLQERQKEISRSYQVNKNTRLSINNKFGKVHINVWDKNQIDMKVTVVVERRSEAEAQRILEQIEIKIDDDNAGDQIEYRTEVGKINNSKGESFEINYEVSMPAGNPLEVKNSFGDFYLDNFKGPAELDISYGNMKVDNLDGPSEVKLSFGKGLSSIAHMRMGEVTVKYSDLSLGSIDDGEIDNQFGNIKISKAGNIELDSKYGDIEIGEIDNLEGDIGYSGFMIVQLNQSALIDAAYGKNMSINNVAPGFQRLEIETKFSGFDVYFAPGVNASLEASLEFGNLKYEESLIKMQHIDKNSTSSEYRGQIGTGTNLSTVIIDSSYGNVRLASIK